jgi:hypothetical protein
MKIDWAVSLDGDYLEHYDRPYSAICDAMSHQKENPDKGPYLVVENRVPGENDPEDAERVYVTIYSSADPNPLV